MLNEYQEKQLLKKLGLENLDNIIITSDESYEVSINKDPVNYIAMESKPDGRVWNFEVTPKGIKNLYQIN